MGEYEYMCRIVNGDFALAVVQVKLVVSGVYIWPTYLQGPGILFVLFGVR